MVTTELHLLAHTFVALTTVNSQSEWEKLVKMDCKIKKEQKKKKANKSGR